MSEQINSKIDLEIKSQTIYFETENGKIEKYYHLGSTRLNHTKAIELLTSKGYKVKLILKVSTERITLEFTEQEIEERIKSSESFYIKQK